MTAPGEVVIYDDEVRLWVADKNGPVMQDIERRATRVQTVQQAYVRKRTGYLLSTIRKQRSYKTSRPSVTVVAGSRNIDYTWYEDQGTRPHVILPRNKQFLRFVDKGGRIVFAKRVNHPGTTGSHFIERSMIYAAG
jgi:hypothetical protein